MKKLLTILLIISNFTLFAQETQQALQKNDCHFFIENKGQWPEEVLFLTRTEGMDAWITSSGVVYDFFQLKEMESPERKEKSNPEKFESPEYSRFGHVVKLELQNSDSKPKPEGKEKSSTYYNYFIGNDSTKWASFVGLYKEAVVKNIYEGIDVRYYFDKNNLRYDYIVNPGANPDKIIFTLNGSNNYYINENSELVFTTRFGEIKLTDLFTYQILNGEKKKIESRFAISNDKIKFKIDNYLASLPLVIDPLVYSTFIGGSSVFPKNSYSIKIDNFGNAHITGYTSDSDFPATPGSYDPTFNNVSNIGSDVFVTKFNNAGSALIFSTFIGSDTTSEKGYDIDLDAMGNIYVIGEGSPTFPITAGAYHSDPTTSFLLKLNNAGSTLLYSTGIPISCGYFVLSQDDLGIDLAVSDSGYAYVAGRSDTQIQTTPGAYDETHNGNFDIYVMKLNQGGTALIYATFIGSTYSEIARGIAIDNNGNAYITGYCYDFPITSGAYQTNTEADIFVCKLNNDGSSLIYSTRLGSSSGTPSNFYSRSTGIAVDNAGYAYITGYTNSSTFPITGNAYDTTFNGDIDIFVTKLNLDGSNLIYSTFIGSDSSDVAMAIDIDNIGNVYVTGNTKGNQYPNTYSAIDKIFSGSNDIFVTKLASNGSDLIYSTFLGGSAYHSLGNSEDSYSISCDDSGNAYITGETFSTNFVTTTGSFDPYWNGPALIRNNFVCKLNTPPCAYPLAIITGSAFICQGMSTTLYANTGNGFTYQWLFNGNIIPGATLQYYVTSVAGPYQVIVTDSCNSATSLNFTVFILTSPPQVTLTTWGPSSACMGDSVGLQAISQPGSYYKWFLNGNFVDSISYTSLYWVNTTGNYSVIAINPCGSDTSNILAVAIYTGTSASITGPNSVCVGNSVTLNANTGPGLIYQWKINGNILNGATSSTYTTYIPGWYSVVVTNACGTTTSPSHPVYNGNVNATISASGSTSICQGSSVTLNANTGTGLAYQWRFNGNNILGATDSSYSAGTAGNYTVVVSNAYCNSASNAINVQYKKCVSPNNNINSPLRTISKFDIELFPNPSQSSFNCLITGEDDKLFSLSVFDYAGRIVEVHENLISNNNFTFGNNFSPGFYFVEINTGEKKEIFKIVKLE